MRKELLIPSALILDKNVSPSAKVVYAILKSFQIGKPVPNAESEIVVTHREIIQRSDLSQKTIVKALNNLEETGWLRREMNWGSASTYIFTVSPTENQG